MAKYGPKPRPAAERFWDHVERGDNDKCWTWTGAVNADGYGFMHAGDKGGRWVIAHRLSWEIHNGPIPKGTYVLHRCDNPPCVNPAHLWLGSQRENMQDCKRKGRTRKQWGDSNSNAKIEADDLPVIKRLWERGMSQMKIADIFGIKQPQISRILLGKSRNKG